MNEYQRYGEYAEEQNFPRVTGGRALVLLLIGVGIGAGVAILLTPRSGRDIRDAIGRGYRRTLDGVTERTRDLRERGSNLLGFTREAEADRQYRRG